MMIRKKYYLLILVLMVLPLFSITPIVYCDEYELDIDENYKVVWEVTEADEEEIDALFDDSEDLDDSDFDYEEDDRITYEITSIDEDEDEEEYMITCNYYENDENLGARVETIAMDPEDMAEDWEDLELDDYTLMFVLTDTEDYIEEFAEKIAPIYQNFVYVSGSSIIVNSTIPGHRFWLQMEYDERGILEQFTLVYDGNEIFAMEQKHYSRIEQFPLLGIIIAFIIISLLAVGVIVIVLVVVLTRRAKKKKIISKTPTPPPVEPKAEDEIRTKVPREAEVKKEPEKVDFGYCEKCGSKRESDATFCAYCGNKF